jgi:hypothetical protein
MRGLSVPMAYQCSSAPIESTWQYSNPLVVPSFFRLPEFDDATNFLPFPSIPPSPRIPIQWAVTLSTIHLGWHTELYDSISYILFHFPISICPLLNWTPNDAVLPQSGAVKQIVIDHV